MKVKISFISDLHALHGQWEMKMFNEGKLTELHNADVIVFCGDMSGRGRIWEVENFLEWFNTISPNKNAKKIFIAGNHDFFFDTTWFSRHERGAIRHKSSINLADADVKAVLAKYPDLVYLEDSSFEYMGLKFWGSPITPWFHDWAFNRWEDEIEQYWTKIPDDVDVLITHGPPFGIGDHLHPQFAKYNNKNNVGCPILLKEVEERIKPSVHAFGHIHEAYGIYPLYETDDTITTYLNASCLNQDYSPVNGPITVEIDTETKVVTIL